MIELTFAGYKGGVPVYMPVDAASQEACKGNVVLFAEPKKKGTRTNKQNSAMHKFFRDSSLALNEAGYDMRAVIRDEIEIEWDKEGRNFKENIWKPVQKVITNKDSTADLDTSEVSAVYETLNRHIQNRLNVHLRFPSLTQLLFEQDSHEKS